jgi:hypothetical protein
MSKYYPSIWSTFPGEKKVIGIAITRAPVKPPATIKKTSLLKNLF